MKWSWAILFLVSVTSFVEGAELHPGFKRFQSEIELNQRQFPRFPSISAMAIDGDDNLYLVSETGRNVVQKIDHTGRVSTLLTRRHKTDYLGLHIAADEKGVLYLSVRSRYSIEKFDPEHGWTHVVGQPPSGKAKQTDGLIAHAALKKPGPIAVSKSGAVYFADSKTIRQIKDGKLATIAGDERIDALRMDIKQIEQFQQRRAPVFITPVSVAVDDDETVYVLDNGTDHREPHGYFYQQLIAIDPDHRASNIFTPLGFRPLWTDSDPYFDQKFRPLLMRLSESDPSFDPDFSNYSELLAFASNYHRDKGFIFNSGRSFLLKYVESNRWRVQEMDLKKLDSRGAYKVCVLGKMDSVYCLLENDQLYVFEPDGIAFIFNGAEK